MSRLARSAPRSRSRPNDASASGERHRHRIDVETGGEPVHVTLGGRGDDASPRASTPDGGFCKFFNRVIDNGLWAELPDAARAVYLPLVRLADGRGPFRARAGLAALMKHSGLSRSSVKRGLKALQDNRLIVVVRQGGVDADGVNRSNVYELLVPEADGGPAVDPRSVQPRTARRAKAEPTAGPIADPVAVQAEARAESAGGPLLRASPKLPSPEAVRGRVAALAEEPEDADADALRMSQMLARWGFATAEAARLVREHGAAAASTAMRDAREMNAGGRLHSPAGFLRWRLSELGPARPAKAESRLAAPEPTPAEDDADLIDALADDVLTDLAEAVKARYAGNAAMLRLLTAKPPRRSPLMRAEVAALLRDAG